MTKETKAAQELYLDLTKKAGVVFVFGSNLAGKHGAGSAKEAARFYGAERGVGQGRTGNAYAIPTKDEKLKTLSLQTIEDYVQRFITYAKQHPELTFNIVAIGCGLAGYRPEEIAPMFRDVPSNCNLPKEFIGKTSRRLK